MGTAEQWRWWEDDPIPDGAPEQTRDKSHPDGFSFLLPPDQWWAQWLQFTSQELARLDFIRWRYQRGDYSGKEAQNRENGAVPES